MNTSLIMILGLFVLLPTILLSPTFADQTNQIMSTDADSALIKTTISMNIPSNNELPWAFIEGTFENHVDGIPVVIQIYQDGEAVHFAQTDVNDDGSYEYKFWIRSVDNDRIINVFEGDYDVKIFQAVKLKSELSI